MKTEELTRGLAQDRDNTYICEECVHLLVAPKARWLMACEDVLHAIGEIAFVAGKWLAALVLGAQYLFEAIFPHINRIKTAEELQAERKQKEWEEDRELNTRQDAFDKVQAQVQSDAAYLNSLRTKFARPHDEYHAGDLADHWISKVDRMNASQDFQLDFVDLRKNAVETENLFALETARNARRAQLEREQDHHIKEMNRWNDRAYAAYDSKEKQRCEREAEHHQYQACYAKAAYENI